MPKNKKPAGGRMARNFDPRYAESKRSGSKPGSRSPKHRGYREEEPQKKARWNAAEREARSEQRDGRGFGEDRDRRSEYQERGDQRDRRDGGQRSARSMNTGRREFSDRAGHGGRRERDGNRFERGDRFERSDRSERRDRFDRDERAPRRFDRDEREPRRFSRDDHGSRGYDRDDRPTRRFDRDDRAPRRFDGDERAPRREGDSRRRSEERPGFSRFERAGRDRGFRGDRGLRDDRAPRRRMPSDSGERFDRSPRSRGEYAPRRDSSFYPSRDDRQRYTPQEDVVLERLEADAIEAKDVEGLTFAELGLGGNIVRSLTELGAESPFPIQAATIPDVLAGKDVLGRGRTGSGKTIAFGAPLVEKLMENGGGKKRQPGRNPRALILAPTRELALQIDRTVQPIARSVGLFTTQIYGGVPQYRQVSALQRGVDIVIGTPGRIEDLIEQGRLDLSDVTVSVLDEADHMCDLGFLEPVQRILRRTAHGGQKLLFSATLDKGVAALVNEFLVEPAVHEVAGEDQASSSIDHRVLVIEHRDKDALIEQLADREEKTVIFARTRAYAERLTDQLEDANIPAVALHGDLNQAKRTRNLQQLTSGRVNVLVATDVAARGIHVDDVTLVIQADAPDEYKTYLHRSGRTGRAGKEGTVVTLISRRGQRRMSELLDRAEIEAGFVEAYPGDDVIDEIAGRMTLADLTS